jgi:fucose permease
VSTTAIGLFAIMFLILYVIVALPSSWLLERFGFHKICTIGGVAMTLGAFGRGVSGPSYGGALASTTVIAAAQPLLLSAWSQISSRWFQPTETATATGVITLFFLIGAGAGFVVTPALYPSLSIPEINYVYGAFSAVTTILFALVARDRPPTPPGPQTESVAFLDAVKRVFRIRAFVFTVCVAFLGLGIFNGVSTWIELIVTPRGFSSDDAGYCGALLILGGLIGSIVLSTLSDKLRRRQYFMLLAVTGGILPLIGLTYATVTWLLYLSSWTCG